MTYRDLGNGYVDFRYQTSKFAYSSIRLHKEDLNTDFFNELAEYCRIVSDKRKVTLFKKYWKESSLYYLKVWAETERIKHLVPDTRTKLNNGDWWCLDHIVPIIRGEYLNIDPVLIGGVDNLQWLTMKDNRIKSSKLTRKGIELLKQWGVKY